MKRICKYRMKPSSKWNSANIKKPPSPLSSYAPVNMYYKMHLLDQNQTLPKPQTEYTYTTENVEQSQTLKTLALSRFDILITIIRFHTKLCQFIFEVLLCVGG